MLAILDREEEAAHASDVTSPSVDGDVDDADSDGTGAPSADAVRAGKRQRSSSSRMEHALTAAQAPKAEGEGRDAGARGSDDPPDSKVPGSSSRLPAGEYTPSSIHAASTVSVGNGNFQIVKRQDAAASSPCYVSCCSDAEREEGAEGMCSGSA